MIFWEGNACERIIIVQTGRVKMYRTSPNGREQTLETLGPGDSCACNPGVRDWNCSASAKAVETGSLWYFSREDYVSLVEKNARLSHTLNRLFADRYCKLCTLVEEVSLYDAKKRLVKFLLETRQKKLGEGKTGDVLYIPLTREEIAQRLGTTRETVARYLHQLKRQKLIGIESRQVKILNLPALERFLAD